MNKEFKDIDKFVDVIFNFDEDEFNKEVEMIKAIKNKTDDINKIIKRILSSDTILSGEYFVIHSDFIYDLINVLKGDTNDNSSNNI